MASVSAFVLKYRTPRGRLYYCYRDMRDRVNGKPLRTGMERIPENCPWLGLPLDDRVTLITWALNDPDYNRIFDEWKADGFKRRSSPTAHRIDRNGGYTINNIQWVKHVEKSRKHLADGQKTRARKKTA